MINTIKTTTKEKKNYFFQNPVMKKFTNIKEQSEDHVTYSGVAKKCGFFAFMIIAGIVLTFLTNFFCKLTNTTYSEDENFINLTHNDFTLEINKENNFFVVNNEDVVYIEEKSENSLYPLNELATALGFKATFSENNVKLSRPYQTKRVIVKATAIN